jgi:hypothetical protein
MSKAEKPKRKTVKPRKRGPVEERLIITEDPKAALDRLLKKPSR